MAKIHLGKNLSLPAAELATKIVSALGMRGSGKSNLMTVIAEQLLAAGIQVVVLDDVGIHFGLRLKPDGKTPSGLNIPVMGGQHGDIPLLPTAGTLVAQALAESGSSAILDISGFRKGERARFAAAFAEALLHSKKEHPGPLFLILEESQRWIPQVIRFKGEGEERMLGAFMDIAEVGRNYGIGLGLVSQRPQKVHKEALNLTELLFCFQTNGVLERKAIAEWVKETGAEGRDQVDNDLPGLQTGEALVWSPSWLRMFQRTSLPKKTTYDAGATPLTARAKVKTKPLELGELSAAMAAVTEEAKASDPKALKAEVVRLKAELAKAGKGPAPKVAKPAEVERVPAALRRTLAALTKTAERFASDLGRLTQGAHQLATAVGEASRESVLSPATAVALSSLPTFTVGQTITVERKSRPAVVDTDWQPQGGALRMLQAIAASHADGLTWRQIATLAQMKHSGGSFSTYKSALRTHGCIDERGERVYLTELGHQLAGDVAAPVTGADLVAFWKPKLSGKAKQMLEVVVALGPSGAISRSDLAQAVEMEAGGGSFSTYLSALRSNGLVEDRDGGLGPAEVFFR